MTPPPVPFDPKVLVVALDHLRDRLRQIDQVVSQITHLLETDQQPPLSMHSMLSGLLFNAFEVTFKSYRSFTLTLGESDEERSLKAIVWNASYFINLAQAGSQNVWAPEHTLHRYLEFEKQHTESRGKPLIDNDSFMQGDDDEETGTFNLEDPPSPA